MARTIAIDPLTRIEGNARITLQLDDTGQLVEARFHVLDSRGFERFCVGRPFTEMPGLTARICGICPVSHLLASARAGDKLLAVQVPVAAQQLRRLLNLAQIIQSHALSFFHLSSPDLLLGWESDPQRRHLFGLMAAEPELARAGIRLRQFGQQLIEQLTGRRIPAAWVVPGGVARPLGAEAREVILGQLGEARAAVALALGRYKRLLEGPLQADPPRFGCFDSLFMALASPEGRWECCAGTIKVVDSVGNAVAAGVSEDDVASVIAEVEEPWSRLRFPYYRPWGSPDGLYRVGPLARLNICEAIGTPWADAELRDWRSRNAVSGRLVTSSFAYHQARLVEIVAALEAIEVLLDDPQLLKGSVRARAELNALEAVGVSEAPRGILFHHYRVDADGLLSDVNLIIATAQNNLAMNRTVLQIAREFIPQPLPAAAEIPEPMLNRIEAGIRCFDPCLSCGTHAAGVMPLQVELRDAAGQLLAQRVQL